MKPGAPVAWAEAPGNVPIDTPFGGMQATDRAFAGADHVVAMGFQIDRVTGVPHEPRRVTVEFYPAVTPQRRSPP